MNHVAIQHFHLSSGRAQPLFQHLEMVLFPAPERPVNQSVKPWCFTMGSSRCAES